ncbi:MAG: IPT/TIG domain-containing protein, partial [Desulfatiglandales bacterium]
MINGKTRTVWGLGLIFLFAIILSGCGSEGGGEGSEVRLAADNDTALIHTLAFTQLVINDVDEDEEVGTLTIIGVNFDNGYEPVVSLDDEPLTLISYTANIIVVSLPVSELTEDFVITVKTGDGMENYDFYSVTQDDEDPVPLLNRLVVFGSADDSDENQDILNIIGQNFDNGYWPPDVMLNDIPLNVYVANSNSELLVLVLPDEAVAAITD